MNTIEFKQKLVEEIAKYDKVKGIGQTGDVHAPLIPGQSDIDLFVLCSEVPTKEERIKIYDVVKTYYSLLEMEVCSGGVLGDGDILISNDVEVMPMYFTIEYMENYLNETLSGMYLDKQGRFYPIGRLASIETINILYEEKEVWTILQNSVKEYPESLFRKWYLHQISSVLDEEDLGRVLLRKEVLFYHQVLEEAIDHLLQALYAINHQYFPSRKRTQEAIESFQIKPNNCYERLLQIISCAVSSNTIETSVNELKSIVKEIEIIGHSIFK